MTFAFNENIKRIGVAAASGLALCGLPDKELFAQDASTALPAVTVDAPRKRAATAKPRTAAPVSRSRTAVRSRQQERIAAQPVAQPLPAGAPGARVGGPRGPINGYVANRSSTGTKTDTPLNETPQSISVIGSEQIRDQQPQTIGQAIQYSPGVFGSTFGADTRSEFVQIRGFPAEQSGWFLDGLQLFSTAYATWKLRPFGMGRIEVLRGPSSVLYGGSNAGGMINAISKLPQAEPIHYLEAGVNNYGNRYVQFDLGDPIALAPGEGSLAYRLVGRFKAGDTQVRFIDDDSYFIAPSVTYRPDADTSITVMAQASKDITRGNNWLPYEGTVTPAPFGRISTNLFASDPSIDKFRREQAMIGYQFEHSFNDDFTFRQNMRYGHVDVLYSTLLGLGYDGPPSSAMLARGNFQARDAADQANIDNQLEWRTQTGALQHKILFGVDYKYYGINDRQAFTFGIPSQNLLAPVYGQFPGYNGPWNSVNQFLQQNQTGVYLQDQIKLDRWTLVLSGRNDWIDLSNDNRIGPSLSRSDSKPTGRAGLIYNGDFGLSPYVSYATYFNPVPGTDPVTSRLYLPESGVQSEAGVKWQPPGFDGHIDFAVFDIRRQNVITATSAITSTQLGEVVSRGIELSATANVTQDFKLLASFSTFDLHVTQDPNTAIIGKVPVNTPTMLASFWGDYTFHSGWLAGFGFGGGVRYVGETYADNLNTLPVPDYLLGDVSVHYEWDKWRAQVNLTNITDKVYVGSCATASACYYGDRRRVLGSLSYKW